MRTLLLVSLFLTSQVLLAQRYGPEIKDHPGWGQVVCDYGNFLSYRQEGRLEDELKAYRRRTGNAIVVITLSTLPYSIKETSIQYFNKWGIGSWSKNNGVLLLVSRYPRRVRITTGSGIDDILTDYKCQHIIDETIVPSFKAGDFYTGLADGVNEIEIILGNREQYTRQNPAPVTTAPQAQTLPPQQVINYGSNTIDTSGPNDKIARWIFWSLIAIVVAIVWRIRYLKSLPLENTYSSSGYTTESPENTSKNPTGEKSNPILIFLIGVVMALFFVIKFVLMLPLFICGFFGKGGGSSGSGSGASYGGGRTSGGGASGSW
ncbi:hypothetical protein A4D02_00595 [Niastella koreensis]|uniref:TPM domain-containing protein n=2 Tax=Niastella koreensis TaxID=354356 RepID=G8TBA6_NIAKG|nr:TPM domain-containing protein [Niastella koreensis]AEW02489.1 protein of unknown function DUF477 [Niastella koreensis GR20-10]OQP54858.1 hypothetical protein A4D02_00595 [Niastella koreensis]